MDALLLSRIQFGFVISFHVLFPAFTIGLSSWLAFLEWRWLRTRDTVWRDLYFFWLKIFAVSFGMGVVSGIVMSFQFGTNWAVLSERAGNILGPLLSYEVLTAFFLEASFLGVMLFGWHKVPEKLHFLATCLVAIGTLISTFWILSANSWLQTPAGYAVVEGVFHPANWREVIFNPSFPYRLTHMVLAAFITTCFVIGGVSGWYLRRGEHLDAAGRMLKLAVAFAAIALPLQIAAGDAHGLNTLEHQPIKVAAMEGHWHGEAKGQGVPLVVFAVPNEAAERNDYEVTIPRLGSVILTHTLDGEITPLTAVPRDERPPVKPVFYAFRVMVGLGMAMLLLALVSLFFWWRGTLLRRRALHLAWNAMLPAGFVALVAGWFVTEIGRQPYVIYGLLHTRDAVSPTLSPAMVWISLSVYVLAYALVFGFGSWYILRMLRHGPLPHEPAPRMQEGDKTPARPLSAADDDIEETR
ncbi:MULTISPECIES: cytochrome ubiquinol oxidase subunit I [Xanthomonas]|uniref:Cytochrome ubiquinol oxidase subunit I n=3 Tax=Xanthomonas TaxID=338 RepID=A0A6N7QLD5_9XANT|nr:MULTISPECIES: cytochrome ubiquinol oxidase subunit I [Xanthomonas]AJC46406.1 cytochrome D ubiquinol oxidase subunit I [Xanthomonas sacchari]KAA8919227.1 cytochrome ubiquinol oxidase subunit I [Xanthomonas sontii]KAB7763539.1 cytochrome ubiquinol oxidase subunit I [Xanthomonas sp. LMG 12461]KAB7780694.1 cytochrome ubiquinol oxidase subunit I [Xanthomonas sp. LMG 12460]MCW0366852.1 Cytochrome bd-II ubiquinol oxidase subunit 1 [Xanthomonas sacchari]